ncbi:MAG: GTP-binding protein [Desulfobacteraceae bacterium]|nr:GTP-binding protein [Desulfobacteraceae bacterium]
MADISQVYLITGFLGAGKTTFLNRIIAAFPKNRKLTLLVNEFGEIGVDGHLVEGDDIDMMEISKGSIFCVCVKTDFIKGLYELHTKVEPDVLLIESSGVANPADLKKDLALPIFNNRFQFKEQFCLIDAAFFMDAYEAYASLEKQIASSTVFIINKTDMVNAERLSETKEIIRRFHPDPLFFETTYADIPLNRFFDFDASEPSEPEQRKALEKATLSPEELETFVNELLDSPDLEITPPDILISAAYRWKGTELEEIEQMARGLPPGLVRAKGFITQKGVQQVFSYVMGDWTLVESEVQPDRIKHQNVIVFIGPPESIQQLESLTQKGNWTPLGTYQPYEH